ncbi:NAD(P)/FAD-dependent oxidoreductase [Erythrobacter sp. SG61-1L]|uniref:FAD-dependent oxidoreductase n=1 Tax=Erythrobacter sp. SG61-1L TaxID=1603897 RepID=UPI0006C90589|nr:NAD(P)/FAD-dependent oxidoreductase [Erythrobacter sp. SG61-1L]
MVGQQLDIAIAGCGMAGLASALLLHRQGHRVTLYERFDQPRPLGSGLMVQPTGLAVLDGLGLAGRVLRDGAPVSRLLGRNAAGRVVLDARYGDLSQPGAFGIGIHRASLFSALYDAVLAQGIAVRTSCEVAGSKLTEGGRRIVFADGGTSPVHDLVVDTLGLHTTLAPPTGKWLDYGALWTTLDWPEESAFDATLLEQRYRAARQMVGVLPVGRGRLALFWSLRADALDGWKAAGLAAWKDEVRRLWPECAVLLDQIRDPQELTFARYAHRTLPRPVDDRLIHIGDSWHSASPQLGQGANMALLDAWALSVALGGEGTLQARLERAIALRRGHVKLYQWLTALFTPLYQSDAALPALLRDRLLAPLSRVGPGGAVQALLVGGLAGAPLRRLGLEMPDYVRLAEGTQPSVTVAVPA